MSLLRDKIMMHLTYCPATGGSTAKSISRLSDTPIKEIQSELEKMAKEDPHVLRVGIYYWLVG